MWLRIFSVGKNEYYKFPKDNTFPLTEYLIKQCLPNAIYHSLCSFIVFLWNTFSFLSLYQLAQF